MNCPLPRYWMCHIAIVLIIAGVLSPALGLAAGLAAGTFFYAGREFTQWEQGGGPGLPFDWHGIAAPAIACSIVYTLSIML